MFANIKELLVILISSSLVSNVVLSQFLGLCPFLGVFEVYVAVTIEFVSPDIVKLGFNPK